MLKQKKQKVKKKIYDKLLAIYLKEYNSIEDKEKEEMDKNMILVVYLLKVINMINCTKRVKKKVNHS